MKFAKIIFFVAFFIASVIFFVPKKSLYYYVEEKIAAYKTVVSNEALEEGAFWLHISHPDIYVEGIRVANVKDIRLKAYILSNVVEAHKIRLSGVARDFLPTRIESFTIRYSFWNPTNLTFDANGEFGTATGSYSLRSHILVIKLYPSKMMQSRYRAILHRMKKEKKGGYSYEQRL